MKPASRRPLSAEDVSLTSSSGERFIALLKEPKRGNCTGGREGEKGYYVGCNIHFPNSDVREAEPASPDHLPHGEAPRAVSSLDDSLPGSDSARHFTCSPSIE